MALAYYKRFGKFYKSIPHASQYPVITGISATVNGLVTWTTDRASSSQVLYGSNYYMGQSTTTDTSAVTSHSVQLQNLALNTTYYYRVQSFYIDSLSTSVINTFTTKNYTSFVLTDTNGVRWAITVGTSGNLISTVAVGSAGVVFEPASIIIQAGPGKYIVTVSTSGNLVTTSTASAATISSLAMTDSSGVNWTLTCGTSGNLTTA